MTISPNTVRAFDVTALEGTITGISSIELNS